MADPYNLTWDEGADMTISIVYKTGPVGQETAVNLTTYKLRMDISAPNGKVISVLNNAAIEDTDQYTPGAQPDNQYEVTLSATGNIDIVLARTLTLPGGPFHKYISANPPLTTFDYDIFLRDAAGKQKKIVYGTINVVKSVTKWQ